MKFLLDQDVYALTAQFLRDLGHDVTTAAEIGLAQATDETLLRHAKLDGCILVTRDRDYGALVFIRNIQAGVLYLRIKPSSLIEVHRELDNILNSYPENQLHTSFIVVTPGGHRVRKLGSSRT